MFQVEREEMYLSPLSMEPMNGYLTWGPFCKDHDRQSRDEQQSEEN